MPIDLAYESDERVVTRLTGTVTSAELKTFFKTARADREFMARRQSLIDCSDLVDARFDAAAVRSLAMTRPGGPGRKVAIVAPSDPAFGLARIFQGFGNAPGLETVRVFRDRAAAAVWLDAPG